MGRHVHNSTVFKKRSNSVICNNIDRTGENYVSEISQARKMILVLPTYGVYKTELIKVETMLIGRGQVEMLCMIEKG